MAKETRILNVFKDGVADGLLRGCREEADYYPKETMYYYNQGYDFGLTMYNEMKGGD